MIFRILTQHNSIECRYVEGHYVVCCDYVNVMLSGCRYAEYIYGVSFMLSVVMHSVIMLNVTILNVIILNVFMPSVVTLNQVEIISLVIFGISYKNSTDMSYIDFV